MANQTRAGDDHVKNRQLLNHLNMSRDNDGWITGWDPSTLSWTSHVPEERQNTGRVDPLEHVFHTPAESAEPTQSGPRSYLSRLTNIIQRLRVTEIGGRESRAGFHRREEATDTEDDAVTVWNNYAIHGTTRNNHSSRDEYRREVQPMEIDYDTWESNVTSNVNNVQQHDHDLSDIDSDDVASNDSNDDLSDSSISDVSSNNDETTETCEKVVTLQCRNGCTAPDFCTECAPFGIDQNTMFVHTTASGLPVRIVCRLSPTTGRRKVVSVTAGAQVDDDQNVDYRLAEFHSRYYRQAEFTGR